MLFAVKFRLREGDENGSTTKICQTLKVNKIAHTHTV